MILEAIYNGDFYLSETFVPRVYLRSQKCWDIRQKAPAARRMSAETLALSRFSRRGTVPACENRSAAPAVPSLLRPQDALGAAAFVECKRMQRSRCAFLVEWDSVEEFSDTP